MQALGLLAINRLGREQGFQNAELIKKVKLGVHVLRKIEEMSKRLNGEC